MRVISGIYKGRRWDVPHSFKARPTTDFAKESLFNVLGNLMDFDEEVTALDLFAGTGSISIELVSRGCGQVVSVEKDREHYAFIKKALAHFDIKNCIAIQEDVFRYLKRCRQSYHLIFADPPYALAELEELPDLVLCRHDLLEEGGIFVLEHGKTQHFDQHPLFMQCRNYGSVHFSFFRKP